MSKVVRTITEYLHEIFDLESDRASFSEIIEGISKSVEFRGTNLWILIFAIMVASVGLNMNSTAVVIGAMLISPLMGPIIGVGLGVGIYDFDLIKKSVKNLGVAVVISVITSTIYFLITPLKEAQSELLGRTVPTIWDVVIAFFGGLAGIVAYTRKEKSNVIPGVAIATALMPPLCTAGFGLATGNWYYFIGAFYLFFINSVFITTATILIVRYLKMPYKTWVDSKEQSKMRNYVYVVVFLTLIPSVYLAYNIVGRSIFNQNAKRFIENEVIFTKNLVVQKSIIPEKRRIELFVLGSKIDTTELAELRSHLTRYNLTNTDLVIRQDNYMLETKSTQSRTMSSSLLEEVYRKNEALVRIKQEQIEQLQSEVQGYKQLYNLSDAVSKEITIQYPQVEECAMNKSIVFNKAGNKKDTTVLVVLKTNARMSSGSLKKLNNWLQVRLNEKSVKILTY